MDVWDSTLEIKLMQQLAKFHSGEHNVKKIRENGQNRWGCEFWVFTHRVSDLLVPLHRNVIHGSDSVESAQKEIYLWFRQNELQSWKDCSSGWIYNWSANPSSLTSVSALAASSHTGEKVRSLRFVLKKTRKSLFFCCFFFFLQLKWDLLSQQCVSNNYLVGIIIWSSWFMFRT